MATNQNHPQWKRWVSPSVIVVAISAAVAAKIELWSLIG